MRAFHIRKEEITPHILFRYLEGRLYKYNVLNLERNLARSRMKLECEKMAAKIALLDTTALSKLQDVGRDIMSTSFSACLIITILTSNHVELVNRTF